APDVDHRLDRDAEALADRRVGLAFRRTVVRDLRVLVHGAADPVPDVVVNDAEPLAPDEFLDGRADIADAPAHLHGRDADPERLLSDLDEARGIRRDLPDRDGDRGVRVPSVDDRAGVDADDVAVAELALGCGDAVNELVSHR